MLDVCIFKFWHPTPCAAILPPPYPIVSTRDIPPRKAFSVYVTVYIKSKPPVDEAHCCDTSRSLGILIGWHSKATSSNKGEIPHL